MEEVRLRAVECLEEAPKAVCWWSGRTCCNHTAWILYCNSGAGLVELYVQLLYVKLCNYVNIHYVSLLYIHNTYYINFEFHVPEFEIKRPAGFTFTMTNSEAKTH